MKLGRALYFLLCFPTALLAQFEFEANYQTSFSSHLNAAVHSGNETWIVGGQRQINNIDIKPGIVFKMNSFGVVMWNHFVMQDTLSMGVSEVLGLSLHADSTVLLCGRARATCDDPPDLGFVELLDGGGTLLWSRLYNTGPLEMVVDLNDSTIVVAFGSSIMGINAVGDSLWTQDHGFGQINSLWVTSSNELVAACTNGMFRSNAQGGLITSRYTPQPVLELEQLDTNLLVHLIANWAVLSDTDFTPLDSFLLDPFMQQVKHLESQLGGFWCIGDSTSLFFDPTFNLGSLWPLDVVLDEEVRAVTASNTRLLFTGTLPSFLNRTSTVKTYSSHGDQEQNGQDVGVSNILVDNLSYTITPNPNEVLVAMDLRIILKNYGTAQNQFVRINAILEEGNCTPVAIWDQVGGLALMPGDTSAAFKSVQMLVENMGVNTEFELCSWTTTPNGKRDRNWMNDEFCKTISVPIGVGIEETAFSDLLIWPNPAYNTILIKGFVPNKAKRIHLIDISGRQLEIDARWNGVHYEIPIQHLVSGIYTVRIMGDDRISSGIFLKE